MADETYNGHANWATWNVNMYAGSDEAAYIYIRDLGPTPYDAEGAESITRELWPTGTPDMGSAREYESVDWDGVAECYNELANVDTATA